MIFTNCFVCTLSRYLLLFGGMTVFFLIKADEKGQIGKARFVRRLGDVVRAALQLAFCIGKANGVAVIDRG